MRLLQLAASAGSMSRFKDNASEKTLALNTKWLFVGCHPAPLTSDDSLHETSSTKGTARVQPPGLRRKPVNLKPFKKACHPAHLTGSLQKMVSMNRSSRRWRKTSTGAGLNPGGGGPRPKICSTGGRFCTAQHEGLLAQPSAPREADSNTDMDTAAAMQQCRLFHAPLLQSC